MRKPLKCSLLRLCCTDLHYCFWLASLQIYAWFCLTLLLGKLSINHAKPLIFLALQILQCLSIQGAASSGGGGAIAEAGSGSGVSRAMVKDRYKTFNIQFEELHQRQSQWTVPDSELRESLRLAVAEVLLPAYRSFIKRFGYLFSHTRDLFF